MKSFELALAHLSYAIREANIDNWPEGDIELTIKFKTREEAERFKAHVIRTITEMGANTLFTKPDPPSWFGFKIRFTA